MRYYLVAGEASGDLHGSLLVRELLLQDKNAQVRFIGGDLMAAETGHKPFMHYRDMAFMGFLEVVSHLTTIFENLKKARENIAEFNPDVVILIDYPGFNLRLAKAVRRLNIQVFYFISPKVWAWNQKRVLKIKRDVNRMFVIFPFEVDFYLRWGMKVDYVGNPLMDAIGEFKTSKPEYKLNTFDLDFQPVEVPESASKPLIALLPGSRKQEISFILPEMLKTIPSFSDHQFKVAKAPGLDHAFYMPFLSGTQADLVEEKTYELLSKARAALVTSGTATLETALLSIPEVVLYKTSKISFWIAKAVIKVRFISLVNLIMDKEVVKELIQTECTAEKITAQLKDILYDGSGRTALNDNYKILASKVGGPGAAAYAAKLMYAYLQN